MLKPGKSHANNLKAIQELKTTPLFMEHFRPNQRKNYLIISSAVSQQRNENTVVAHIAAMNNSEEKTARN